MVYLRVNEMLKEKKKSKYWFVKKMERRLPSIISFNNETSSIHFSTLERLCTIFECTPGDIIVLKKGKKRGVNNK